MKNLKFVVKDDFTEKFESLIEKEKSLMIKNNIKTTFNPAEITECPRRLIYRVSATNYSFQYSTPKYLKHKWLDFFSKCKYIEETEVYNIISGYEENIIADCNYNLACIADLFLRIDDKIVILKIQPVADADFLKVQKEGAIKKHVIDMMTQMWMAEISDGILLYDNNDKYILLHVKPYRPIIESVKRKALKLVDHQIKGTMPDRPYKTKESRECQECEFVKKCWGK